MTRVVDASIVVAALVDGYLATLDRQLAGATGPRCTFLLPGT